MMITQRQFHFSWATGSALMTAGAVLAATGIADLGLFWVGGIITTLAFTARMRTTSAGAQPLINSLPALQRPRG